jgi:hypothetical protein
VADATSLDERSVMRAPRTRFAAALMLSFVLASGTAHALSIDGDHQRERDGVWGWIAAAFAKTRCIILHHDGVCDCPP